MGTTTDADVVAFPDTMLPAWRLASLDAGWVELYVVIIHTRLSRVCIVYAIFVGSANLLCEQANVVYVHLALSIYIYMYLYVYSST